MKECIEVLANALARFSVLSASLGDLITELDVNPIIAGPGGALAADVLALKSHRADPRFEER